MNMLAGEQSCSQYTDDNQEVINMLQGQHETETVVDRYHWSAASLRPDADFC